MRKSMGLSAEDKHLKILLKSALSEVLEEKKDLFHALFLEVLEDIALARAIDEEKDGDIVSREEVFTVLRFK